MLRLMRLIDIAKAKKIYHKALAMIKAGGRALLVLTPSTPLPHSSTRHFRRVPFRHSEPVAYIWQLTLVGAADARADATPRMCIHACVRACACVCA